MSHSQQFHKTECSGLCLFRFMIQSDVCETWYHGSGVGITEEDGGEALQEFYCSDMCATRTVLDSEHNKDLWSIFHSGCCQMSIITRFWGSL